jgi:hypothetical protein
MKIDAPIGLTVRLMADGKLYPPRTAIPFTLDTLPKHLRRYMRILIKGRWASEEDLRFRP